MMVFGAVKWSQEPPMTAMRQVREASEETDDCHDEEEPFAEPFGMRFAYHPLVKSANFP
jgi:hypothetical protein